MHVMLALADTGHSFISNNFIWDAYSPLLTAFSCTYLMLAVGHVKCVSNGHTHAYIFLCIEAPPHSHTMQCFRSLERAEPTYRLNEKSWSVGGI